MITCLILSLDACKFYNGTNLLGFSSIDGRLAGLFGDRWLLGRYLVYVLPILIAIYFLENEFFNDYKILIFIVFFLTCVTIVFSGERAAFLILLLYLSLLFFYFVTKLSIFKLFQILFVLTIFFISPFLFSDTSERLLDNFVLYLTSLNLDKNQYLSMFLTSWNMFIDNPLFGVGPNNFRYACSEEIYYLSKFSCSTHPHNIVFQILAEIGIIGFIAVYSVLFYFILKSFPYIKSKYFSKSSFGMYSLQCSVILYLFPFMISGNFFLSWYGMIYYLPIGLFMVYLEKL